MSMQKHTSFQRIDRQCTELGTTLPQCMVAGILPGTSNWNRLLEVGHRFNIKGFHKSQRLKIGSQASLNEDLMSLCCERQT